MKISEVAERIDKHQSTIRQYATKFSEFLSPQPGQGKPLVFNNNDLAIIAFISKSSDEGWQYDEIRAALQRKIAAKESFILPHRNFAVRPKPETNSQLRSALAKKDAEISGLQGRLAAIREQLEANISYFNDRENIYINAIADLNRKLGESQGELKLLKGPPPSLFKKPES